ncbi:eukaryotic translation initiation factor 4 gamma 2 [Suncus etruscus]|uniref:eukaryotic translation initiation factor 4 gamma 2 n=1 Tax=Suncus etruscus TaxID=109475 RepID=UPI00210F9CE3|nr:eukaryotic translation initiation factor 4 gamma 2 [Suncus etruscus]
MNGAGPRSARPLVADGSSPRSPAPGPRRPAGDWAWRTAAGPAPQPSLGGRGSSPPARACDWRRACTGPLIGRPGSHSGRPWRRSLSSEPELYGGGGGGCGGGGGGGDSRAVAAASDAAELSVPRTLRSCKRAAADFPGKVSPGPVRRFLRAESRRVEPSAAKWPPPRPLLLERTKWRPRAGPGGAASLRFNLFFIEHWSPGAPRLLCGKHSLSLAALPGSRGGLKAAGPVRPIVELRAGPGSARGGSGRGRVWPRRGRKDGQAGGRAGAGPAVGAGPAEAPRRSRAGLSSRRGGFSFLQSPPLPTPSINIILLKILRCQAAKVESAIAEGGASRFSASSGGGGSRGAPQHYPKTAGNSEFLGKTPGQNAQKWIPARSTRRDDNSAANNSANEKERHDAIFRKVRGILNKLTPEKFDKLCLELLNVGVESKLILKGVILLIVDKALEEPKYSSLYAQLCLRLAEDAPNFDGPAAEGQPGQKQSTTFRRLLISKLQDEFENRTRNVDVYDKRENPLLPEEEEQRAIAKIKMLGNIKFIGELGKLDLIHESILHKCIKTLLEKKKRVQLKDMGEDLECLCQIMRTVGPRLDHERAKSLMDQYFARMCSLMLSKELPARIRFLLQDTVELREHHWVPRKAFLDNGPKTINQIRQDAVKDLGVFIPAPMAQGMRSDFFLEGPFMPPRMKMDRDPLGGLADMFGQMPGSGIGTGPGVIQDRFSPTMGRHRSNQLFNGHGGHIMPPTQSQFGEMGGKFMKSQGLSQLYHNQSQGLLSQLQGQSKDMPPRFSKKGQLNADEISLRPAQSFLMSKNQVPKLQPQITMIPPSAQPPRTQTPPLGQTPQLGLKTNPPLIQEKPAKTSKKPPPSKEELLKLTETVVTEYLNSGNANEAVNGVREMRAPKHFLPEMLSKVILLSLDRSDEDKEKASSLISLLKQEGIATSDNFMQAFLNVLDQCPKLEVDIPLVKSYLAQFAARAIISELVSISELAQPLESGTHFPLFLLCLQQLAKLQDREWLTELFQQSKVNMQKMLPEIDQNKDRMLEILEGKGLSFLFPLLKLEKELLKQIKLDPSPQTIYKWIKDNISPKLHVDKGFVNILMTSFLQYISSEVSPPSDETDSSSAPSKEQLEQEKQLLLSFKPVMQKFLHDHVDLQVSALYALQVHCYNSNFPKGMLLRFFVHFYDMEIIEEEAFLAWKEDITQEFPGKGKALFQVNQWLTWLETAEEEESEEEAD